MAIRGKERRGQRLRVRHRGLEFSFWPMAKVGRRYGLQSRLFASDPWNVIEHAVNRDCPLSARKLALAFLEQARDFYTASQLTGVRAAKPLLVYYSFMNLVKVFALTKKLLPTIENSHHGLSLKFSAPGATLASEQLEAYPTTATAVNLFDLLLCGLNGHLHTKTVYDVGKILPQILLGHRLWCEATDENERFIEVEDIQFRTRGAIKACWIRFDIRRTEFGRLGYSQKALMSRAGLTAAWQIVEGDDDTRIRLETILTQAYSKRPSDVINKLVEQYRGAFWRSITITKPFRKYYVYLAGSGDLVLPQIASIYAVFFYLASLTRYRPNQFDELVASTFGGFVQEFIENQPRQWLFMLASELMKQEVTRAAVV